MSVALELSLESSQHLLLLAYPSLQVFGLVALDVNALHMGDLVLKLSDVDIALHLEVFEPLTYFFLLGN